MTLSKPETGEKFGHVKESGPLAYVGALSNGSWLLEDTEGRVTQLSVAAVKSELFPYREPVEPLEAGQFFQRTRYDYSGQVAEVLAVFTGRQMYSSEGPVGNPVWVAFHLHHGHGSREPRLKDETSFRRLFGERVDPVS